MTEKLKDAKLYLIPNILAADTQSEVVTPQVIQAIKELDFFVVENIRTARRFAASLKVKSVAALQFEVLDKNTQPQELTALMQPLVQGRSIGVISEAGCPAVADPGNMAVSWAHKNNFEVVPLVGPSSILLALMGSGMNGQSFEFHGYLPIEGSERSKKIKALELESSRTGKTQLFMETPYRNDALLTEILRVCSDRTLICIASNLTAADQSVKTKTIANWKKTPPDLHKKPTIFLIQS